MPITWALTNDVLYGWKMQNSCLKLADNTYILRKTEAECAAHKS